MVQLLKSRKDCRLPNSSVLQISVRTPEFRSPTVAADLFVVNHGHTHRWQWIDGKIYDVGPTQYPPRVRSKGVLLDVG